MEGKKLTKKEMSQITGGGFWLTVWALSLTTIIVTRSILSDKASIAINGVGRASWDSSSVSDKKMNVKESIDPNKSKSLFAFFQKFYEI